MAVRSQVRRRSAWSRSGVPERQRGARLFLGALPLLVMAAVALIDVLAGPRFGFLPVLSLGPALAAVSLRPARTALVGVAALMVCALLASYDELLLFQRGITSLATIAGVTAAGAVAAAVRGRRESELANVSTIAETAQRILLRPVPGAIGAVRAAALYVSASASARIGGDLYEAVATPRGVRLIVADVQGKGLIAAQTAATVLGTFREAAYDARDLADIATRIEISLERQAAEEEFVTAVLAQIVGDGSAVEILNCGHPSPLLARAGAISFADPPEAGLPLGLAQLATCWRVPSSIDLPPDARLLFYTDGISEARDRSGRFYPLDRCGSLLAGEDLDIVLGRLRDDVVRHVGHQLQDDAAMLLVTRRPGSSVDVGAFPAETLLPDPSIV